MQRLNNIVPSNWLSISFALGVGFWLLSNPTTAADYENLDDYTSTVMAETDVAGVSLAVVADGKIAHLFATGLANTETGTQITPDTLLQVGSISKPVAAWAAMTLVQRGLINLDTPVSEYLTRWEVPPSEYDSGGITLRRLLSHTAGLSLGGYPGFDPNRTRPTVEASLSGDTNGPGAVFLQAEPGTSWSYSGGGYTLMQLIVEEVSGKTFADYAEEALLAPLNMQKSSYSPSLSLLAQTAQGHGMNLNVLPNYRFTAEAAAGLHATAEDLARFMIANMSENPVLTSDNVQLMHQPAPATDGTWGLGFSTREEAGIVGHGGSNVGWKALMSFTPGTRNGIVLLTNSDSGSQILEEVLCYWSESFNVSEYKNLCAEAKEKKQSTQRGGYITVGILAFVLFCLLGLLIKNVRSPQHNFLLSGLPLKRKLLLLTLSLILVSWFGFWHTTLGVQLIAGFSNTRAIDFVPAPFLPGSPLVMAILLAAGLCTMHIRHKETK